MSGSVEQVVASAYVFGASALVFSTLPFVFCVLRGMMKASEPNSTPGGIFGIFLFSFSIHLVACIMFMIAIKIIDIQSLSKKNHLQNCVFRVFWAQTNEINGIISGECGIKVSKTNDNPVYSGSLTILNAVQSIRDWFFILLPPIVIFLGISYGVYMSRKDTYKQNSDYTSAALWSFGTLVVAYILFVLWANIANFAMFNASSSVLLRIEELYNNIIEQALSVITEDAGS